MVGKMVLDFQVKRRGSEFIIVTGISYTKLAMDYPQESSYLTTFNREGDDFVVPRHQLCNVLDRCFDHFTEESLVHITKLLDKNEEAMRERIHEQSVSKKKKKRIDEHRPRFEADHVQASTAPQAPAPMPAPVQQKEPKEERRREERERERERDRDYRREVRMEEELSKTEVLKLFYQIKSQMDALERYLHKVK